MLGGHGVAVFALRVIGLASVLFVLNFFKRLYLIQDFVRLPLSPQELVVAPLFKIAHRPPEARLERSSD